MSCNHCNTKFNFFHKEMGCASCGLSFCHKCLKQKCRVPAKGAAEHPVCRVCFAKISSGQQQSNQANLQSVPDSFLKRLENHHQVSSEATRAPNTVQQKPSTSVDQRLAQRLEKLKEKPVPPSEAELRKRLAILKDNDYVEGPSGAKLAFTRDDRTDQQKVDVLLEQFVSERDIELAQDPQEEIEARLATLRGKGVRPNEGKYISNLHDSGSSEEDIDKITKKIMDEVALEERCPKSVASKQISTGSVEEEETGRSSPELPWCVLCNSDAKFRCRDCSGDLYCADCHREVHQTWGDTDHRVVPFKPRS